MTKEEIRPIVAELVAEELDRRGYLATTAELDQMTKDMFLRVLRSANGEPPDASDIPAG